MNRNLGLFAGNPVPGFPGQVPWINPVTNTLEWVNCLMADDLVASGIGTGGLGWTTSVANSGTVVIGGNTQGHAGVISLNTNALSNGNACLRTVGNSMTGGGHKQRLLTCLKMPALSNGTDRYEVWFGFSNSTGGAPTTGVYFDYIDTLNSGNWTAKTSSGGSTTTASGGANVAVVANAWYWLYIEYDGVVAKFWVATDLSGSVVGVPGPFTFIGQSTTNLPTANQYGLSYVILKSLGTTPVSPIVDKVVLSV